MKLFYTFLFSAIIYSSCIPANEFEKNVFIPNGKWHENFKPNYDFEITDTASNYLMYFTIRHTEAYPFSNIWVNIKTKMPLATTFETQKKEIVLAQDNGKWLGRGMNEIWEQKISLVGDGYIHFSKKGIYTIQLEQIMRKNPLPEVLSVGIRLEKMNK